MDRVGARSGPERQDLGGHGRDTEDADLVCEARAALGRLRAPATFGGVRGEWADDLEPQELGHRHLSHLYGVFPGSRWAAIEPDEEVEASRAALSLRLAEGSGYTGWSQAWVLCLAARLRDGVRAERAIETLLGPLSSRSLLDLHPLEGWPGGAVFQIDGNLGAVAPSISSGATGCCRAWCSTPWRRVRWSSTCPETGRCASGAGCRCRPARW
ncbi:MULTISPECIES: glycosyl hydrolase family 95 catalytic domain-containing protein [Micromonospora]|uniref:glycosyl hydrolase family 95 catalytic domain-containing protein n=1 Tax=Micromonospora TaxID=1873 RepID=UPI0035A145E1